MYIFILKKVYYNLHNYVFTRGQNAKFKIVFCSHYVHLFRISCNYALALSKHLEHCEIHITTDIELLPCNIYSILT